MKKLDSPEYEGEEAGCNFPQHIQCKLCVGFECTFTIGMNWFGLVWQICDMWHVTDAEGPATKCLVLSMRYSLLHVPNWRWLCTFCWINMMQILFSFVISFPQQDVKYCHIAGKPFRSRGLKYWIQNSIQDTGWFFNCHPPPNTFKYGKPRLGDSMLT